VIGGLAPTGTCKSREPLYDGHTLGTVIPQMEALIGNVLDRCITDAGYRGHNAPPDQLRLRDRCRQRAEREARGNQKRQTRHEFLPGSVPAGSLRFFFNLHVSGVFVPF